jgi:predicted  nucleic acid-binding Zn-ribbon protein
MQSSLTSQLGAARDQQSFLQSSLNKQQHAGDLLSKSQEARVSSAESAAATLTTQLEDATQALADTKTKVVNLKADLKMAKDTLSSAEKATSQETDEEVMKLNVIIGDLEATIAELSKHAGDILRRYKLGQLVGRYLAFLIHEQLRFRC